MQRHRDTDIGSRKSCCYVAVGDVITQKYVKLIVVTRINPENQVRFSERLGQSRKTTRLLTLY